MPDLNSIITAVLSVLFFVVILLMLGNVMFFRSMRIKKVARRYGLPINSPSSGVNSLMGGKTNIIEGEISGVKILFYDLMRRINWDEQVDKAAESSGLGKTGKVIVSKTVKDVVPVMLAFGNPGNANPRGQSEKISCLSINGVKKFIGYSYGSMTIVKASRAYISLKLLNKILSEVKETGRSNTFDSLQNDTPSKFKTGRMMYVENV